MDKDDFKTFLTNHGWEEDKWGHMRLTASNGRVYRWKIQKISTRLEVQTTKSYSTKKEWFRYRSIYFSQMIITDGKISGKMFGTDLEFLFGAKLNVPEEIKHIVDGF